MKLQILIIIAFSQIILSCNNNNQNMTFRVARHTNNLSEIEAFYINVIGFENLGSFKNHDGYDGVFLGLPSSDWHLEFTSTKEPVNHEFDDDDLLVFYPSTEEVFQKIMQNIKINNIKIIKPKNPYWKKNGVHILDPDGYGLIISAQKTNNQG
ncbi:VOC family protein [Flavivirga sp. 57AJ16]|uniref:VOC family protein n=1 Tax=Flavivirga sp. 57AJ16 TaxID=3025307 RepID=UPI0023656018|nr:VOC family protein [Flavivirga sp. 57AJ16]MDD7886189.1 VOC family protein [Flavivirga sp. 57AJ16]